MDYLNLILGTFALAGLLGTVAGSFYGVRQKTIITTLELSNKAYRERNEQLELESARIKEVYTTKIAQLEGRVHTLEKLKTPPIDELKDLINNNHSQVLSAIEKANSDEPRD